MSRWRASDVELPIARIVPPASRNAFNCGNVLSAVMLPERPRYSSGMDFSSAAFRPLRSESGTAPLTKTKTS